MVCMGNICRSPTAHGVLEKRIQEQALEQRIEVDSAGTHGYHVGTAPDQRAQAHALRRGYALAHQRARRLQVRDFSAFDLVLVMDDHNEQAARALCPPELQARIRRLTDFSVHLPDTAVPDPYYGGEDGFEHVLDLVEDACNGVVTAVLDTKK